MFVVNDGEEPSEEKPFGLYGIPIIRGDRGVKVGARQVRDLVANDELEDAKNLMAPGDDDIKDAIIDSMREKVQVNEEYFDINGFSVDKEIVKELSEERYIDQAEESGLAREQCNAQKIWIGATIQDPPATPKPDMVVFASQPCDSTNILYQLMENYYKVPTFTMDIPYYFR